MASKVTCAGCLSTITSREYLKCCSCNKAYDLVCANIATQKFNTMTKDLRSKWLCQECKSKRPKTSNTNTPVRSLREDDDDDTAAATTEPEKNTKPDNITVRRPGRGTGDTGRDDLVEAISERVLASIRLELPSIFSRVLSKELSTIKTDVQELRKSVEFISGAHDDLKLSIETLVKDNTILKSANQLLQTTVHDLEGRLNGLEQHLRENNLELHGVPEFRSENLSTVLNQCAQFTGHKLNDGDVVGCVRVAKLNKDSKLPKTIVAKFRSVRCRDEFYSAVYRYNKANPNDKLNTNHLGIAGEKKPVYVSEHLSPFYKTLHAASRKKAKETGYKFVWVRNGRIFVRKDPDSSYIHIKNQESLALIR